MSAAGTRPKILFILYQFPPSNDVGAQRPVRFIKHLHRRGWQVFVVAPSNGVYHSYAPDMGSEIEKYGRVIRVPMVFPASRGRSDFPGALRSLTWRAWNRMALPDGALAWLAPAVSAGIRTARNFRIPLILASGQPFTTFLAAALVGRRTGAAVVFDYRDLWSLNPFYKGSPLRRRFEMQLEKYALRSADAAVFVTDECRQIQSAGLRGRCRYLTITNAFEALPPPRHIDRGAGFRIVYAGNFYGNRSPDVFFRGLADACARDGALAEDIRVDFYGVYDRQRFRRRCRALGLEAIVRLHPRIPRAELLGKLQQAGLLLLINSYGPGHEMFLPAKFFDYLAAGRPILCLAENGALKNAVRHTGAGTVVDPRDARSVSRTLTGFYRNYHRERMNFRIDPKKCCRYRAAETGEQLETLCRELVAMPGKPRAKGFSIG